MFLQIIEISGVFEKRLCRFVHAHDHEEAFNQYS